MLGTEIFSASAGRRRAMTVNLAVFFAFALTALIFLTRSALAAAGIDDDVAGAIRPATTDIKQDITLLSALDRTVELTERISGSTAPLEPELVRIVDSSQAIDDSLAEVGVLVPRIERTVGTIRGATTTIDSSLHDITSKVEAIARSAGDVSGALGDVSGSTRQMVSDIGRINRSLASVLPLLPPVAGEVSGILHKIQQTKIHARNIENSAALQLTNLPADLVGDLLGGGR